MKRIAQHAAALVAVVCTVVALSLSACGSSGTAAGSSKATAKKTVELTLNVTADAGWNDDSTPAIAHIEGKNVDFYHAVTPGKKGNKGSDTVKLNKGTYTVSFISPINGDGSVFDVYKTGNPTKVKVDAGAKKPASVDISMKQVPADQVTDEMLKDIIGKTTAAVNGGDATLKGDAGTAILDKLNANVEKNANASDETKDSAAKADETADVNAEPAKATASSDTGSKSDKGATKKDSSSKDASDKGSSDKGSSGSKATHTHSWVNHTATRQVWVSSWVDVPDYTTESVYDYMEYTFEYDGFHTTSDDAALAHCSDLTQKGLNSHYTMVARYKDQTVQSGSHKEDHGSYQNETYVDYVYCSSCGARK